MLRRKPILNKVEKRLVKFFTEGTITCNNCRKELNPTNKIELCKRCK